MKNKLQQFLINNAMKNYLIAFITIMLAFTSNNSFLFAENYFDTKGKDFWLTYLPNFHNNYYSATPAQKYGDSLYIFITSDEPTSGKIEYYDRNDIDYVENFTITDPTQIYIFKVSYWNFEVQGFNQSGMLGARNQSELICRLAFHITSDKDITVYGHSQSVMTSDAFLVLPSDVLGTKYFVMAYNSDGSSNGITIAEQSTPSEFAVVATEDGTEVTIKPSAPTFYNGTVTQTVQLGRGEVYLVQAGITTSNLNPDLTGSEITSNKPIAVFGGHQRTTLPVVFPYSTNPSRDCLIEQMPPLSTWGQNAFLIPLVQSQGTNNGANDLYRIMAAFDNTDVYINEIFERTIDKGEFIENKLTSPAVVRATQPILVAQYKKTAADGGGSNNSDPFMMLMPPKEQFMNAYKVINTQAYEYISAGQYNQVYTEQYITVIVPNEALTSLLLDGNTVQQNLFVAIPLSNYSYANFRVADGRHILSADKDFGICIYGYGQANSYGYIGGMSLKPIVIQPPEITSLDSCYKVKGIVYNPNQSRPCIERVTAPADSSVNTKVNIENFTPYVDTVRFSGSLNDIRRDGKFSISAQDSTGAITTKSYDIPGFTLAMPSAEFLDSLLIYYAEAEIDQEICFYIKIHNYGNFSQLISRTSIKNSSMFSVSYDIPKTLYPGQEDSIKICFKTSESGFFTDTLSITGKCGSKNIISLNISTSECDRSAFEYVDFKSDKGLNYQGASGPLNNKWIRLTSTEYYKSGAIWRKNLIPVYKGFTTTFQFRITEGSNNFANEDSEPGADGIAFVIQNYEPYTVGVDGGGIGYHRIPNSIAIEFDTFSNDEKQLEDYNDPNGNHIAVQSNGLLPNSSYHEAPAMLGITDNIMNIKADGTIYYAKIDYKVVENTLRVFLDTVKESSAPPVLEVANLDLGTLLNLEQGVRAYVGFTAATGSAWENHDILSWYFCPVPTKYVSVKEKESNSMKIEGLRCYPNPFSDKTTFEFSVERPAKVKLQIFDVLGNMVEELVSDYLYSGEYQFVWDAGKYPRNVYYCRLQKGSSVETIQLKLSR